MENQENGETLNHFLKAKILKLFFPLAKNTKYTVMYEQNTPTELFKEKKKKDYYVFSSRKIPTFCS